MSRDDPRHLLTAAIDGALTPAERKEARRLVRESGEARALFLQLKRDADRLKALRRLSAPPDLADLVLGAIRDRRPTPLPPTRSRPGRWSTWMTLATAAGILLAVSAGSFVFFTPGPDVPATRVNVAVANPFVPERRGPEIGPQPRALGGAGDVAVLSGLAEPEIGPMPREAGDGLLVGGPVPETPAIRAFQLDAIRFSTIFTPRDLPGKASEQTRLQGDIKKDELIRLDLFTPTLPTGTDLVLSALKARGIEVYMDAFAQERRKKNPGTELVIFTEAMTPAEVAQFLTALGAEDKRWPSPVFDTLVVAPFLPYDLTQLATFLGLPAFAPAGAKEKVDVRKPLPEGTANQVAATLTRMGGTGSTTTAPKSDKVAVIVAYAPANPNPAASKEIRQFLARRGDRKPNAKPLMLVLRSL